MNDSLSILFEDDHCLALDKPAGQFSQGPWAPEGDITLETAVRRYLDRADPHSVYLGFVHRLDRPTSGVILWAKTAKAARRLATQFEKRSARKEYWAIVESAATDSARDGTLASIDTNTTGSPAGDQGWNDWLTRADQTGRVSAVRERAPGAREAVTTVRVVNPPVQGLPLGCCWLKLWPQTGRTHQLRIQAARRGTPIVGDVIYGARGGLLTQANRIALHARSLELKHPTSGKELLLVAPVPSWWKEEGLELPGSL